MLKRDNKVKLTYSKAFSKKEDIIAETEKEKDLTQQKINDIEEIIKIVGDSLENQIEIFKNDKTQNYYKYLKIFAILQRESNRVIRELWTLVGNALKDIAPNAGENDDYPPQNENTNAQEQNYAHEEPQEQEQNDQNEIHEEPPQEQYNENVENQENVEEPPAQEGEEGENLLNN